MSHEVVDGLYFPVYEKIEQEVLELTSSIHFTDKLVNVFSMKIADLIVRCSIEIESIAKDIYRKELMGEPEKTGECFNWLEENWIISRKAISIVSPSFHFINCFVPFYRPFSYRNKSDEDYYGTYNSIKHDRVRNLEKANINCLMRALGALYILNLYYSGNIFDLKEDMYGNEMDISFGSNVFRFYVAQSKEASILSRQNAVDDDSCIYRIVCNSRFGFIISYVNLEGKKCTHMLYNGGEEFQKLAKRNLQQNIDEDAFFSSLPQTINNPNLRESLYELSHIRKIESIVADMVDKRYSAVINRFESES